MSFLPKLATASATLLILSLGLCGANSAGYFRLFPLEGSNHTWWGNLLAFVLLSTGLVEAIGIILGCLGLLCAAVFGLFELFLYLAKVMKTP